MEFPVEPAFLPCRWAAFLRVTGEDASSFLQGQLSQDLRRLTAGGPPAYGLLLSHKGRIQADAFILRTADGFRLASYECSGESLRARLESYIIADDVTVEDLTADYAGLAVLADLPPEIPLGGFVFPGRRALTPNWEIIYPTGAHAPQNNLLLDAPSPRDEVPGDRQETSVVERDLLAPRSLGEGGRVRLAPAREQSPQWWETLRIRSGIPSVPRDAGPGDLPQEAGLTTVSVSFDKGCYLGQEIMGRLKTRGRIRRGLRVVRGRMAGAGLGGAANAPEGRVPPFLVLRDPGAPRSGTALTWQGKTVGELRSWAMDGPDDWVGLAMVLVDVPADAELSSRTGD